MQIRIGQTFRVPASRRASQPGDFYTLAKGAHNTGVNLNRGIFYYAAVKDPNGVTRIPAFLLYSNNLKGYSEKNPWLDIVDAEDGYALYHGDNRTPGRDPRSPAGNRKILEIAHLYDHPDSDPRTLAPPMVLFESAKVEGKTGSYRRLAGYGVPRALRFQSQMSSKGTFTNLVLELVFFSLEEEGEQFDWEWIDRRRDRSLTSKQALQRAPAAWRRWVRDGDSALEASRRRVYRTPIHSKEEQDQEAIDNGELVQKIYRYYGAKPHAFEGLASWVAHQVLGPGSSRGWVTPRVDGGIDFVSRLDLGSGFSTTTLGILGQAKCIRPDKSVRGLDLARTAARLRRGWIGVVVTTGFFSKKAQEELLADRYPIVLIHGARLAQVVQAEMVRKGLTLKEILDRETEWYHSTVRVLSPDRIVFGDHWGTSISDS